MFKKISRNPAYAPAFAPSYAQTGRGGLLDGAYFTDNAYANAYYTDNAKANRYVAKGGIIAPRRILEINGRIPDGNVNVSGKSGFVGRWFYTLGTDAHSVSLWFPNFFFDQFSHEVYNGNDYLILSASLELPDGSTVPITFSGERSKVIPDGANNIYSDAIFGLGLSRGDQVFVKFEGRVPFAGGFVPWSGNGARTGDLTGGQTGFFDPAVTTASTTDASGVYTATGTAFSTSAVSIVRPALVGQPVVDGKSFLGFGDSLIESLNDTINLVAGSRGYFVRALYGDGTNIYPGMNLGRGSALASLLIGKNRWKEVISWANIAVGSFFTNDIQSARSVGQMQADFASVNSALRAGGIEQIHWISLLERENSTDSFATVENQTPVSEWGAGGKAEQMNQWYPSQVTAGNIDGSIDIRSTVLTGYAWKADGVTANLYTSDGVHPSSFAAALMGAGLRTAMDNMTL